MSYVRTAHHTIVLTLLGMFGQGFLFADDRALETLPISKARILPLPMNKGFFGPEEEWGDLARTKRFEKVDVVFFPKGVYSGTKPAELGLDAEKVGRWLASSLKKKKYVPAPLKPGSSLFVVG